LSYQLILNKKVECPDIKNGPPKEWPMNGSVEFVNYSAKYKDDLDYALKNLNLTIRRKGEYKCGFNFYIYFDI